MKGSALIAPGRYCVSFEWSVSPYINHFISADSLIPNPTDPQSWNRYSYVNNNPLRYTDPTGHMLDYGGNEGGGGCSNITCFLPPSSSGSTPTPSNTPQPTNAPTAPSVTIPTVHPTLSGLSGTPNPSMPDIVMVSTQTPTVPPGWTPQSPYDYDLLSGILDLCGGPSVPGDPTCAQIANGVGQVLPWVGAVVLEPGPVVEFVAASGYAFQYGCTNYVDCSIGTPHPYTPYPVTPSATSVPPTFTLIPSTTPSPTLPYITPTVGIPSSTPTYWPTP